MPRAIDSYRVVPSIPERIAPIKDLIYNLYWSWNMECFALFQRLDSDLWEESHHNPVLMLGTITQEKLEEVANDDGFVSHLYRVYNSYQDYLNDETWYKKLFGKSNKSIIAYFSMEYGLTDCLQIYSGGLGVLAGDHLKSSSELGIPLVGIGLAYTEGYFQQYLNLEGWQLETYPLNDFYNLPMTLVCDQKGIPIKIQIEFPNGVVNVQIWKVQVGRIPLYLLDTNVPENSPEHRKITYGLYRGGIETRIAQEIVLGIGGIRALITLGYQPEVCHMNEGHSAFLSLEKIRILMKDAGLSFREAMQVSFMCNVFTTHTPVPAGIDIFSYDLIEKYFHKFRQELNLSAEEFFKLGKLDGYSQDGFNMAHLAVKMSAYINGVSELHSKVAKKMWAFGWKDIPQKEIPISYITNGIHIRSHISHDMEELFTRYLGENWIHNPSEHSIWKRVEKIPDVELWRTHERRRERLVAFARKNLENQLKHQGATSSEVKQAQDVLDPTALTIGFARRFATYKRATLIFHDLEKLSKILLDEEKPVQIIFSGKAHPQDEEGKQLIKKINTIAKDPKFRRHIVFLENYDMNIARYMVQGCDVWLNTPRRPLEASGTSGMKVVPNGGLNLSILDGWWCEGYDPEIGWSIGQGEEYTNSTYQDEVESNLLYQLLANEITPLFYKRSIDGLPREWITMVKNSMKALLPYFNTNRMVQDYFNKFYLPSTTNRESYRKDKWAKIREFITWKNKVENNWHLIKIENVESKSNHELKVGETLQIFANIYLAELNPKEVSVEVYHGKLNGNEDLSDGEITKMQLVKKISDGLYQFKGEILNNMSGRMGYTIRVLPKHDMMIHSFEMGLIHWA